MPRGEHLRKLWQDDPDGMRLKTQAALKKARAARIEKAEEWDESKKQRLQRLFDWCDEQDKIYEIRKAKGDFLPKRVPLWTSEPIKTKRRGRPRKIKTVV